MKNQELANKVFDNQATIIPPDTSYYNRYIESGNKFIETYGLDFDTAKESLDRATLESHLSQLKDSTALLKNAYVPSKFKIGHSLLINGANIAIEAIQQIIDIAQSGHSPSNTLKQDIFDKFDRADLLIEQGQKELTNALSQIKSNSSSS